MILLPKMAKIQKNATFLHFFSKIFGHVKKKQYLCTRFRKGSMTYGHGAIVEWPRTTASHAVNRGSSPRSTTKSDRISAALFVS